MSDKQFDIEEYFHAEFPDVKEEVLREHAGMTMDEKIEGSRQEIEKIMTMLKQLMAMPEPVNEKEKLELVETILLVRMALERITQIFDKLIQRRIKDSESDRHEDAPI